MENWYSSIIDTDYKRLLSIIGISINYSWFIKSEMCMKAEVLHSVTTIEDNGRFQPRPRRVIPRIIRMRRIISLIKGKTERF